MKDDFSRGDVAFARDGFTERAQNGQRVSVRSPVGTPHDRDVRHVVTEEGGEVWAISMQVWPHVWSACSRSRPAERAGSRSRCRGQWMIPGTSISAVQSQD